MSDKVSGNLVGIWLLIPEHLRLGTWDMLCGWTGKSGEAIEPRLAMQMVHESALCVTGIRDQRCLSQKGFELANGLPFVSTDQAIHDMLNTHTIEQTKRLQITLGKIRRSLGHFKGSVLAIDPHRVVSYSKRQMRKRQSNPKSRPTKTSQTFFCLDAETHQPLCMTTATAARTTSQVTPELLEMTSDILSGQNAKPLVLADCEHFTTELFDRVHREGCFDLLVPMPKQPYYRRHIEAIAPEQFISPSRVFDPRWAGLATAKIPYELNNSAAGTLSLMVQRLGERPDDYQYKSFLSTADRDEVEALTIEYPKRWHIEEFFNAHQALGWKRAGTQNLHIRYGQMTMALIAQAAVSELRKRLDENTANWDAKHLARELFRGLDGDIRVCEDTILITYYNAPQTGQLRRQMEHLPQQLAHEGVDPRIPWLYNFKLDFRFK